MNDGNPTESIQKEIYGVYCGMARLKSLIDAFANDYNSYKLIANKHNELLVKGNQELNKREKILLSLCSCYLEKHIDAIEYVNAERKRDRQHNTASQLETGIKQGKVMSQANYLRDLLELGNLDDNTLEKFKKIRKTIDEEISNTKSQEEIIKKFMDAYSNIEEVLSEDKAKTTMYSNVGNGINLIQLVKDRKNELSKLIKDIAAGESNSAVENIAAGENSIIEQYERQYNKLEESDEIYIRDIKELIRNLYVSLRDEEISVDDAKEMYHKLYSFVKSYLPLSSLNETDKKPSNDNDDNAKNNKTIMDIVREVVGGEYADKKQCYKVIKADWITDSTEDYLPIGTYYSMNLIVDTDEKLTKRQIVNFGDGIRRPIMGASKKGDSYIVILYDVTLNKDVSLEDIIIEKNDT